MRQISFTLRAYPRGFHSITKEVEQQLNFLPETGILHLFIKHTSAALAINEDADPSVRDDFETVYNKLIPENKDWYTHTQEGPDDMPAHIKAAITGSSLSIPISNSRLNLGIWQGIYLCEFRNHASGRTLVASIIE
jgi:secondary thiamine-phosphate synthase enzyme